MVGKLQDVVSAAVVVNAAEKYNATNREGANQQNAAQSFDSPAAAVDTTQTRFIVDGKSIQTDADSKKKVDDSDIQVKKPLEEKDLANITQELNKLMSKINANLQFNYHKEAGMFSVALVDKDTNEVIKELPPEEMVKNIVKGKIWMDAFIGTFIDESA